MACLILAASTHAATWKDVNGIVCVEIEGEAANGKWTPETTVSGFSGTSYYRWDNNNSTGVVNWSDAESMTYTINITQAGNYQFLAKGLIGYDNQIGEHNDAWLRMSGVPISGEYSIPTNTAIKFYLSKLGWTYHSATKDEDQQPIRQYFSAGQHTVRIAGRSSDYCIDRFMLIHESRWDELLKSGTTWNSNPAWGNNTSTLNAIAETPDDGPNTAPLVDAGADATIPNSLSVYALNATVSDDGKPLGGSLTYNWTQESGPTATIDDPSAEDTTVTLPQADTYVFRLTANDGDLSAFDEVTVTRQAAGTGPLAGQIIVDPVRGNYFVRNQDLDGNGELDPYMMAGVGGPEQFLYLGTRQSDGTRSGGRQQEIIDELIASGANGIYLQSIRSFGGDAGSDNSQAPFNVSTDPDSGLDPDIMAQWHGWFSQMRDADIGILFFIYDDNAKPWGSSGDSVPSGEQAFLTAITNEFEGYPNIIFVMAEEYQFAGFSVNRMSNMAAVVAAADDYDHAIGVHHNIGLSNQYIGDPNINVFVQQADLRNGDKMSQLHDDFGVQQGFDEDGRYAYVMGEGFGYHQDLVGLSSKRDELRQSMYATAMAGGILTVFGAYESAWGRDPLIENLEDMGRVVEFFHSTQFNALVPNDAVAFGDTDWAMADTVNHNYIAYSLTAPSAMGVTDLINGRYDLRWFDAKDGEWVIQSDVDASGDTAFTVPASMNNDTVLEIILVEAFDNQAPNVQLGSDISVPNSTTSYALTATVSDDGKPDGSTLTYSWEMVSGPDTATFGDPTAKDTTVSLPVAGTYNLRLSVSDTQLTGSDEIQVTRQANLDDVVYAINCGGPDYTATDGLVYEADNYFQSGSPFSRSNSIANTDDDTLFNSERYAQTPGTIDYAFPVVNGDYLVTLMWSENTGSGRIMDVQIEGNLEIDNLDVIAAAGGTKTAYQTTVSVSVGDSSLDLSVSEDASATEGFPNIMAIKIEAVPEPAPAPTPFIEEVIHTSTDVAVSLSASKAGTYTLESTTDLVNGPWIPVPGASYTAAAPGEPITLHAVPSGGDEFFRVVVPD